MRHPARPLRSMVSVLVVSVVALGGVIIGLSGTAGATTVSTEAELRTAFATDSTIDVAADITLTDCTGGGAVERLVGVTGPITIDGHGHTIRQTCTDNVFIQNGPGLFTAENLTITGGHAAGNGGGIFAAGPLTVLNSSIVSNRANAAGGGIGSNGTVTITGSTIDSNISGGGGGGISTGPSSSSLTLTNSTVSNNVGSGIGTAAAVSMLLVNSTVAGNTNGPGSLGGGIFNAGTTTLVYSTIVRNTASAFSNIDSFDLVSFGSVIALPGGPAGSINCLASTTSSGFNYSDDDSCHFGQPTDHESAPDPQLGALANNGGPTQTVLPNPGSPLIDAIPISSCQADGAAGITTDQRGVTRPQAAGCDIGAVEVVAPVAPTPVVVTPRFTG
jgi:hypothetical protein